MARSAGVATSSAAARQDARRVAQVGDADDGVDVVHVKLEASLATLRASGCVAVAGAAADLASVSYTHLTLPTKA